MPRIVALVSELAIACALIMVMPVFTPAQAVFKDDALIRGALLV